MIRIDVKDYCHACMDFSPNVTNPTKETIMLIGPTGKPVEDVYMTDTIVQCEYRKRCETIRKYLERQTKTEEAVG